MRKLRRFIAWICAILFVITTVAALILFEVESKAFSAATYKRAFKDRNLYERMPAILGEALSASIAQNPNVTPYLATLTATDWEASLASLLPPEGLKTLTNNMLDSMFDYLNGKTDSVAISLEPIKQNLAGPSGVETVKQVLKSQQECTVEQLLQMGLGGKATLCNPPNELMDLATPFIESQLQAITATLPDEIPLISSARSGTPNDPRLKLDVARSWMRVFPLFPLAFLLGLTILVVRNLMDWLKWWGWLFLIAGAMSSLIALLGAPVTWLIIERLMQNQVFGFVPPVLLPILNEIVNAVAVEILKPVAIEGAVLALPGLVMVLVYFYLRRRENDQIIQRLKV